MQPQILRRVIIEHLIPIEVHTQKAPNVSQEKSNSQFVLNDSTRSCRNAAVIRVITRRERCKV